jgi:hypothetical protein
MKYIWESTRSIGRNWWFLGLWLLPQFLLPYASRGYSLIEWGTLNAYIITHPIKIVFPWLFPVFQIIPLAFLIGLFIENRNISRLLSGYIGLSYGLFAILQSVSVSNRWGWAVCTGNLVTFLLLAGLWLREATHPKNHFDIRQGSLWNYWPLVLALFAFWGPINSRTLLPDFDPTRLFTSGSGLSFCMATPLYLAILILSFPHVNNVLMASTSFVGLFMGISNLILEFIIYPDWWWIGVLHFPLVILSFYSLLVIFIEGISPKIPDSR